MLKNIFFKQICFVTAQFATVFAFCQDGHIQNLQIESSMEEIDLSLFEKGVFSQNGEDGVLEKIFETIGIDSSGYYVEFGATDGHKGSNSKYFREKYGWKGLLLDSSFEDESINLHKAFITAENINELFALYNTPYEFDLLSIDIDYNDFYVWQSLSPAYQPKVIVFEYNAYHLPTEDRVVIYNPEGGWDGTNYFGASLLAFYRLGREKGYSLVYAEKKGVNGFFIRDDILESLPVTFRYVNDVEKLYKPAAYGWGPRGGHSQDSLQRPYLDSSGNFVES